MYIWFCVCVCWGEVIVGAIHRRTMCIKSETYAPQNLRIDLSFYGVNYIYIYIYIYIERERERERERVRLLLRFE